MKKANISSLQFENPEIEKWSYIRNEKNSNRSSQMKASFNFTVESQTISSAKLILNFKIEGSRVSPIELSGIISSVFRWDGTITEIDSFLKVNGASLLISYLRPLLAQFTSFSGNPPIILPFFDLRDAINDEEKSKKEPQKSKQKQNNTKRSKS